MVFHLGVSDKFLPTPQGGGGIFAIFISEFMGIVSGCPFHLENPVFSLCSVDRIGFKRDHFFKDSTASGNLGG